ncbi:MAG TPA: hypothetical protein DCR27_11425 [Lachnospiraceae bacterium]|nr:hypothetical protein [Lachnospiraceae bacterium]
MKRKATALLLSATLAITLLAGCSAQSQKESATEAGQPEVSVADDKDTADGKAALTGLYVSHSLTKDINELQWLQELEDQANVEITWEQIYSDWETTKSTRFASGDIPDILINATVDSDYTKYDGLFMELTNLIEKNAPNVCRMFEEEPDTRTLATTKEGNIYATPKFQGKWPATNTVMFINKEWLERLELEMPTTFTELKDVLTAFKEQDANGNGNPDDEVPFDFNAYGGNNAWFNSAYSLTNLLGAMGIQTTNWGTDGYFAEDGKVKNYAVDERYKTFLKYMTELYAEGLINQKALTSDYSTYQSLSRGDENGNALVGVTFGWEETDKFGPVLYSQYVPLSPLDYDVDCEPGTYDTRWRNDYSGLNMSANRACMSAKCSNPEAAMRFIDQFYGEAASVQVLFGGITDGCVEQTAEHSFKVLPPLEENMDPGTWKWTNAFAGNGPMYIRRNTELEMAQDMTFAVEERKLYEETLNKMGDSDYYPQMFMKYTDEDQNTMALTQANVNNIIDNYWSLWLTGESDIDRDWETYVRNVNDAGLPLILEIRQAAFDAYRNQ